MVENLRFAARLGAAAECDRPMRIRASALEPARACRLPTRGSRGPVAGQQRRIAIARLLLEHKPLWLLDEPAAALDAESARLIAACIAEHVERGGIVVMTTHQL